MKKDKMTIKTHGSSQEAKSRKELLDCFKDSPLPGDQLLSNLGLFLESKNLARILYIDFLFRQIKDVQGTIIEFGTRWGQNLALFSALRGIYEPFNRHRKIIGFDTFKGFPSISPEDGKSEMMVKEQLSVTENYEAYLAQVLGLHEQLNPLSHIEKFELCVGDASVQVKKYFERAPETIVALAYFDLDIYEPTKACLEAVKDRLTKGSVVAFDELNDPDSPGETKALQETFGLKEVKLRRYPFASRVSYFVVE